MKKFIATHKITTSSGETVKVMAEEGHENGLILYTSEEWESESSADWEYSDADGLTFQGRDVGATMEPITKPGAPRKANKRPVVGPFTVAPETAAAIEADRREGESKGQVLDRWAKETENQRWRVSKITPACPDGGHDEEILRGPRGQAERDYRHHHEWEGPLSIERK